MRTRLFEWAKQEHIPLDDLAQMTGISKWHLSKVKNGRYPVTERFASRVVFHMGDWARSLFLPEAPTSGAIMASTDGNRKPATRSTAAPDEHVAGGKGDSTRGGKGSRRGRPAASGDEAA